MSAGWTHAGVARQRRDVARLLRAESLTSREVAERIGCRHSTAKSRLTELRRAGRVALFCHWGVSIWYAVPKTPENQHASDRH